MAALLSVADALARVLDGVEPLPPEHAPLVEADGRVLAADVAAATRALLARDRVPAAAAR